MKKLLSSILISWLFFSILSAQSLLSPGLVFHHLTKKNGLSSNKIVEVLQDYEGFFWIGTQDGLNRFDGTNIQTFRKDSKDSNSLSNNHCTDILLSRDGNIWVATLNGLNCFDQQTGKFTRYYFNDSSSNPAAINWINSIDEDRIGNIWAVSAGLWKIEPKYRKVSHIGAQKVESKRFLNLNYDRLIYDEQMKGLWCNSGDGLVFFDITKKEFFDRMYNPENWSILNQRQVITDLDLSDKAKGIYFLKVIAHDYCHNIELVGEAENGDDGIHLIQSQKPDIVFLDIEMPRMDCFKMLQHLPRKNFHLIFTTAYDQYAMKAIKFAAFDYLLKQVDIEELKQAVSKIHDLQYAETEKKLDILNQNFSQINAFTKIAIATAQSLLFFEMNDIIYLEAMRNYTLIHFTNHPKLTASKTLKDFEELLPVPTFFRIHHSCIININYIKKYLKGDGGQVELMNGIFLDVARRKKDEFLKVIAGK